MLGSPGAAPLSTAFGAATAAPHSSSSIPSCSASSRPSQLRCTALKEHARQRHAGPAARNALLHRGEVGTLSLCYYLGMHDTQETCVIGWPSTSGGQHVLAQSGGPCCAVLRLLLPGKQPVFSASSWGGINVRISLFSYRPGGLSSITALVPAALCELALSSALPPVGFGRSTLLRAMAEIPVRAAPWG